MIDIKLLRENPEKVQKAAKSKGIDVDVSHILEIDKKYRELSLTVQKLREERNQYAKELSTGMYRRLDIACSMIHNPKVLILDEPTNHINFRHLPIIAKALDEYQGALIVVSHMAEFTEQIKFDETLDLGAF